MIANIRKFLCVAGIAALGAVCIPMALAQDSDDEDDEDSAQTSEKRELTQKEAEAMAKLALKDDIRTGKLTVQQATDYFRCANDDYAQVFYNSALGKKYFDALSSLSDDGKTSAQEKAKARKELDRLRPEVYAAMDKSEERCTKKLGFSATKGKVFGRK
jgi:hypothetical protein